MLRIGPIRLPDSLLYADHVHLLHASLWHTGMFCISSMLLVLTSLLQFFIAYSKLQLPYE